MTVTDPALFAGSLGASLLLVIAAVAALWWLDRYDREPLTMVGAAYLWGLVGAPLLMIVLHTLGPSFLNLENAEFECRWLGFVFTPAVVEIAKGVGLFLVLSLTRTFDSPTDGFVYGVAVGAGFAVGGTGLIEVGAIPASYGGALDVVVFGSFFWLLGLHVLASSLMGALIGAGRLAGSWIRRSSWGLCGLVCAVAFDAVLTWLAVKPGFGLQAGPLWPFVFSLFFVIVAVLGLILFAEGLVLKRQLVDEVRLKVLPDWTAQVIPHYWRRVRSDWWPSRRERTVISRLLTQLAFRKEALQSRRHEDSDLKGLEIVRLRERIQKIVCPPKSPISPLTEEMW